jgi:hypothetical protein
MSSVRIPDAVKRVFLQTFTAHDVAEPLASFDAGAAAAEVRDFMNARDFDVVGVRRDGHVVGFVERGRLEDGPCGEYLRPLEQAAVLDDTAALLTVVVELNRAPFLFINVLGGVAGIVTPADLQKPPLRMWLFGIVTLIEMRFAELIKEHCPAESWREYLSEGRLEKAQALLEERSRRNQRLDLFDCLQFSDKGQVLARNEAIRQHTVFASRRQAEDAVKKLEQLRNNLAHAQDILASDWDTILQLCEFVAAP